MKVEEVLYSELNGLFQLLKILVDSDNYVTPEGREFIINYCSTRVAYLGKPKGKENKK